MSTARKTYRTSPHTNYQWASVSTHGTHVYSIRHYQMLSQAATEELTITSPVSVGWELYTHRTNNATPATWKDQQ